jgi:membrane-associated phospholipid phosphatase
MVRRNSRGRFESLNGWLWPLAIGTAAFAILHPYDLRVFEAMSGLGNRLGGDVRREWFAWQQYGQGLALIVTAVLIWVLDPARRRRLLDLGLAAAVAQAASSGGKMLVGRPRPRPEFMDPASFPGPWGLYPIQRDEHWTLVHAWDRAAGANVDLWSMPSSHTLFACMFSVFLATVYPRGRWVFGTLAVLVGTGRVVFGAHWPTDVVVGAAVGYAIGAVVTRRGLGVRLLDWVWIRFVDRAAAPAWGRLVGPGR